MQTPTLVQSHGRFRQYTLNRLLLDHNLVRHRAGNFESRKKRKSSKFPSLDLEFRRISFMLRAVYLGIWQRTFMAWEAQRRAPLLLLLRMRVLTIGMSGEGGVLRSFSSASNRFSNSSLMSCTRLSNELSRVSTFLF